MGKDNRYRWIFAILLVILAAALVRDMRSSGERQELIGRYEKFENRVYSLEHELKNQHENNNELRVLLTRWERKYPEQAEAYRRRDREQRRQTIDTEVIAPGAATHEHTENGH